MKNLKTARIVCFAIIFSEFLYGAILFLLNRFSSIQVKPSPVLIKSFYFVSALIVIILFILKRSIFYSKSILKLPEEEVLKRMTHIFIILCAISESISIFGVVLYFITGAFQPSIALVGVSILSTLLVFPFEPIISGYLEEIRRRKQLLPPDY